MIDEIGAILREARTIAIVGASARPERPSHEVMAFLQHRGYRVFPVNPGLAGQTLLGEPVYADLREIAEKIDMVDVFRRPEAVPAIAEAAIDIGARVLWLQWGVVCEASAARARNAGLQVVMDRCAKLELMRRD
jgi:hypothetical protein